MKKSKKKLILISVLIGLVVIFELWTNWSFEGSMDDTFSIKYKTEKKLLSYKTFRDVFGDGFSIKVVKLDQQSQEYFKNPPSVFFEAYPLKHNHFSEFEIQKWTKTPQIGNDIVKTEVATMLLGESSSKLISKDKQDKIDKYLKYTNDLLKTEGSYYAMNFKGEVNIDGKVDNVSGIDLFVISPKDGIIVKINRQ